MFIGHFAAAMLARRAAPRVSLGWLFAAAQLPDLIWPVLLLAGVERARIAPGDTAFTPLAFEHYPWSHSLLTVALWGAALAGLHRWRSGGARGALVIAGVVVSHWVLDWVTHRPDLPLVPGAGPRLGLGLWNSVAATLVVELLLFAAGVALYARSTRPRDRTGRWAWLGLVGFLLAIHVANAFGPPPPSMTGVAVGGLAIWLLVWWGAWADAHRTPTDAPDADTLRRAQHA
jgi:membrane-bound metal-dependent hydrolase YbcI (DUF457 family)